MRNVADIASFVSSRIDMMRLLTALEGESLPDAWIGAGFIRNAVWDFLTGRTGETPANDVDAIYLDASDLRPEADLAIEARLRRLCPGVPWQVTNQARMRRRDADAPWRDAAQAIAHWPETATAIAARSVRGRVEILAPFGVDDLAGLIVRPTPAFAARRDVCRHRLQQKQWRSRWPELTLRGMD
jgi:uncharacterized protein